MTKSDAEAAWNIRMAAALTELMEVIGTAPTWDAAQALYIDIREAATECGAVIDELAAERAAAKP